MDETAKPAPSIESAIAEMQKIINSTNTAKEEKTAPNAPSVSIEPAIKNNARAQMPPDINAITDNTVYTTEQIPCFLYLF